MKFSGLIWNFQSNEGERPVARRRLGFRAHSSHAGMGERRIGSHTHRLWSSGRLGKKMLPLRASVGSTDASGEQLRGSMRSARLSPSTREQLPPTVYVVS